jgi:hypothetical protein
MSSPYYDHGHLFREKMKAGLFQPAALLSDDVMESDIHPLLYLSNRPSVIQQYRKQWYDYIRRGYIDKAMVAAYREFVPLRRKTTRSTFHPITDKPVSIAMGGETNNQEDLVYRPVIQSPITHSFVVASGDVVANDLVGYGLVEDDDLLMNVYTRLKEVYFYDHLFVRPYQPNVFYRKKTLVADDRISATTETDDIQTVEDMAESVQEQEYIIPNFFDLLMTELGRV